MAVCHGEANRGEEYECNNTDDEAVYQNAAQICIAVAFYRLSRSRIN
jgi:hypothetical protein